MATASERRAARLLLAMVVAAACDGAAPVSPVPAAPAPVTAPASPAPAPAAMPMPTLSPAIAGLVGPATAEVLLRGTDRATFVIDARQFVQGSTDPARFAGFTIVRRGRPLTDAEHQRLVGLLLDEASYNPIEKEVCFNEEAYGLRVGHGAEVVELMLVFPCNRVSFLRRASADTVRMPGEYIDPVGAPIVELLRAATRP